MALAHEQIGIETLRRMSALGAYNRWIVECIRPYFGKTILEFGAGIGNMSPFLLDADRLILTDSDERCLDALRDTFTGFPKVSCEPYDLNGSGAHLQGRGIDTVVALNVLEHVEHDEHALKETAAILEPGGCVVLQLPAHQLLYGTLDRELDHFRRYGKREVREKLTCAGLVPEEIRYMNMPGAAGWFVCSKMLGCEILPKGSLGLFDRLTWLFIAIERIIPPPFGLSIIAVGRKPLKEHL